jgi:hypothetical protein
MDVNNNNALGFMGVSSAYSPVLENNNYGFKGVNSASVKTLYCNYSSTDVVIIDRNGIRTKLNKIFSHRRCFIIRKVVTIPYQDIHDTYEFVKCFNFETNEFMRNFKSRYLEAYTALGSGKNNIRVVVDYEVHDDDIDKNNDSIYVRECDIVITTKGLDCTLVHPYGTDGHGDTDKLTSYDGYGSIIEIVDNDHEVGVRFTTLFNQIYHIKPVLDSTRKSGAYIYRKCFDKGNGLNIIKSFIPLEEMDKKLGLFKNKEEAFAGGDTKTIDNIKLRELEYSIKMSELKNKMLDKDLEYIKRESIQKELESKQRLLKIDEEVKTNNYKLEMDHSVKILNNKFEIISLEMKNRIEESRMEIERLNRKDYYESRSLSRKDSSEVMRWVPTILGGALSILYFTNKK